MSKIAVPIRNNATGEIRLYHYEVEDQYAAIQVFSWRDNNNSCDCKREMLFREAAHEPDPDIGEERCGHSRFSVEHITIDGVRCEIETGVK